MLSTSPRSHVVTGVYCISISDHYMTYTVYDRIRIENTPRSKTLRFRNNNNLIACNVIYDTRWASNELYTKWNEFQKVFIYLSDKHAPFHCRKRKERTNPWFDASIQEIIYINVIT